MILLIDTQVLLWFLEDNPKLTSSNKSILEDSSNIIWVSQISLLKIAIKLKIGKLPDFVVGIPVVLQQLQADGFNVLPLQNEHIMAYDQLPLYQEHRDLFDRLILATALHEGWLVMSADVKFNWYKDQVDVIW